MYKITAYYANNYYFIIIYVLKIFKYLLLNDTSVKKRIRCLILLCAGNING